MMTGSESGEFSTVDLANISIDELGIYIAIAPIPAPDSIPLLT